MVTAFSVLLYKPQEMIDSNFPDLANDTFILVLMADFQASLSGSSKIVCIE